MNNSILWFQPEELNKNDVLVVNGEVVEDSAMYAAKFKELKTCADKVISRKRPWCGKVNNIFFVKGFLDGSDERGRKLSFMFMSNVPQFKDELSRALSCINYQIDEPTQRCIDEQGKLPKAIIYSTIGFALILLIVLIFVCYGE